MTDFEAKYGIFSNIIEENWFKYFIQRAPYQFIWR